MANGLPLNLYSGGAVNFNSKPYTDFYLQSVQKKRARAEALDNYFRDFNKTINPAGMRNQDIEGWMSKTKDYENFFYQNKDAILNPKRDNGRAQSEYMARHQDLLADVQRSKNLGDISKQYVVPIQTNPEKARRLHDNSLNAIHAHDASMYDTENHQQLDPSVLDYSAKPFDIAKAKQLDQMALGKIKMDVTIPSYTTDKKGKRTITNYHSAFSNDALKTIGNNYGSSYGESGDDSFSNEIDNLAHDESTYHKLNQIHRSVYGTDIQSNKDFAKAWGLSRVQQSLDEQKASTFSPYTDPFALKKYGYELAKNLYDYRTEADANVLDEKWDDLMSKAKSQPARAYVENGKTTYQHDIPVTFEMKQAYGFRNSSGKMVYPDRIRVSEDNEVQPIYFKYDDKGNKVLQNGRAVVDTEASVPVSNDDAKILYGKSLFGQSATNKQVIKEKTVQQPKGTVTKSASGETKKTIKKSDIAGKAAASGYSPEEYEKLLKQNGVQITE